MNATGNNKKRNYQFLKVFLRLRPPTQDELKKNYSTVMKSVGPKEVYVHNNKKYMFEEVFNENTTQTHVYVTVVKPMIASIIDGYNCTVFAYGQTGTGKTHTMTGDYLDGDLTNNSQAGLIPRSAIDIFQNLYTLNSNIDYTVRVSYIEIYNEEVRDLLVFEDSQLKIFDDRKQKGSVYIQGLNEVTVCNAREVNDLLQRGTDRRHTAATNLNAQSSRSHSVFTITVHTREMTVSGEELLKTGKLYLVDLAGSENVGRSGAIDMRLREAGTINKSLLTLGKVITALVMNNQYIPYRDSKLTRILQDSLGGTTKTCMIATVTNQSFCTDETLSTLEYASLARNIRNCPQVNEKTCPMHMMKEFKDEIDRLKRDLAANRAGEGFYISSENYERMCTDLQEKEREVNRHQESNQNNVKKIRELEEYMQMKEQEWKELQYSFEVTKQAMLKMKEEYNRQQEMLKQKTYLSKYFMNREKELKSTTLALLNVYEENSKSEEILREKINKLYTLSANNHNFTKQLFTIYNNGINDIENRTENLTGLQSGPLNLLEKKTDDLRTIKDEFIEESNNHSNNIFNAIDTFEKPDFTPTLSNVFDTNLMDYMQKIHLASSKIDGGLEESKIQMHKITQLNTDFMKSHLYSTELTQTNLLDILRAQISKAQEQLIDDENLLNRFMKKVENSKKHLSELQTLEMLMSSEMQKHNENFTSNTNELDKLLITQKQKLEEIQEINREITVKETEDTISQLKQDTETGVRNLVNDTFEYFSTKIRGEIQTNLDVQKNFDTALNNISNEIARQVEQMKGIQLNYVDEIKKSISNTSENVSNCDKNLAAIKHGGDTPMRPKRIKKDFVKNIIYKKCQQMETLSSDAEESSQEDSGCTSSQFLESSKNVSDVDAESDN